jgi:hypothetical protein
MCDEDNSVWFHPRDIGTEPDFFPASPDFALPDGDTVAYGTWRWATERDIEDAGWASYLRPGA